MDLERILIDDVDMSEISNYSTTPGDSTKSWYKWFPLGSTYTLTLNNTGEFSWGRSESIWYPWSLSTPPADDAQFGKINGPLCMLYGGGSLKIHWKFIQDQADASCWLRVKIEDYYSPATVYYSTTSGNWHLTKLTGQNSTYGYVSGGWYKIYLDSTVSVGGGNIDTTTEANGYYEFLGLSELTTWKVTLEYDICAGPDNDNIQVVFDKVEIADTDKTEDFACWGTAYAVVHLAWHETLSSSPQFSAIVKGFGREAGEDEGNPALCAYFLLTDREYPDSEPYDIIQNRVDPLFIDWQSVQDTMDFCNSLNAGAGYHFNRAYGSPMELEKCLKEIMAAGRFFIFQLSNGMYFFKPDVDEPLTRIISESDEIVPGSIQYAIKDMDSPNMIRCSYYDAGLGYTVQTLPIEMPIESIFRKEEALDLTGVTDQHQAYELGRYALLSRINLQYSITLDVRYVTVLSCYLGDIVEIDTTDPVLSGLKWRIMAIPAELPGYIYTLQLSQHSSAIYTSKISSIEEGGYTSFTPWYHIPMETSAPYSWPGGNLGPAQVVNLDITRIEYPTDSAYSVIKIEYEYLPSNTDYVWIDYSLDNGQTWKNAGYSYSNTYTFNALLRWGVLRVRVAASYQNVVGIYATVEEYVEGLGGDDAGIGAAQTGWSPIGGDTL